MFLKGPGSGIYLRARAGLMFGLCMGMHECTHVRRYVCMCDYVHVFVCAYVCVWV